MKIVYLIFLTILFLAGCEKGDTTSPTTGSQTAWILVADAKSSNHYYGLNFVNQLNGWAVGDSGKILNTTNGGSTWGFVESGTTVSLKCVQFANLLKGWVCGSNNSIGMTTNGGSTWTWQNIAGNSNSSFLSLSFPDLSNGWIADNYGEIYHTTDGGINWMPQTSGTSWAITSIQFLDAQEGWATTTNRIVLHTIDGGINWISKNLDSVAAGSGATLIFDDIFFINHNKGWIATNSSVSNTMYTTAPVLYTSDGGTTWINQPIQTNCIMSLQFLNENNGWAAGVGGIFNTSNGGTTWTRNDNMTSSSGIFINVSFVDQLHGWALTSTSQIYMYQKK